MTPKEAATKIITLWRIEHTVEAIMMNLLMQSFPANRSQILAVIRAYCDACTENATYGAKKTPEA